jgi:Asp-tRNA(Asn)/Glu-tRNA(Gln) amidotransferase A subunit family amidase
LVFASATSIAAAIRAKQVSAVEVVDAFCGIATIKPTRGRVPLSGLFPPALGAVGTAWHAGPMTRFVDDLALALPILSGLVWRDPSVVPMPLADPAAATLAGLRVAFHTDNGVRTPTAETVATVRAAVGVLADAGARVEEARPPGIEQSFDLFAGLLGRTVVRPCRGCRSTARCSHGWTSSARGCTPSWSAAM